jgi:hypothetical protein
MMGTPIPVAAAVALSFPIKIRSADLTQEAVFTSAVVPFPILPAGEYMPVELCETIGSLLQTWVFQCFGAFVGPPALVAPAAATDIDLRVSFPTASRTVNGTLARIYLGFLGAAARVAGQQAVPHEITIDNATDWAHYLGLLEEGAAADRVIAATGAGAGRNAQAAALWQTRGIWGYLRSELDSGDYPVFPDLFTLERRDGGVDQSSFGSPSYHRDYSIVDHRSAITGPCYFVGEFVSIAGDRKSITVRLPKHTVRTDMREAAFLSSRLAAGRYIQIGHADPWVIRVKSFDAAAGTISFYEKIPAALATPPARSPVLGVPEAQAMLFEAIKNGALAIYGSDTPTGDVLWGGGVYSLRNSGTLPLKPARRDRNNALYSVNLELVRHGAPAVATPP